MVQWFDKPPRAVNTVTSDTGGPVSSDMPGSIEYSGRQPGLLTGIGKIGNAALAPWVQAYGGNMNYQLEQQRLQMEEDRANMEFQKYLLSQQGQQGFDLAGISSLFGGNMPPGTKASVKTPFGSVEVPINREYTQGEVKDITSAESIGGQIDSLKNILNSSASTSDQAYGALPWGGFNEGGQRFATIKKDVSDRLLRLRSGAAINEQEYKRFVSLLPTVWRKDKVDLEQLEVFNKEFNNIEGRLKSGARWDNKKKEFIGGEKEGSTPSITKEQAMAELERRRNAKK